MSRDRLTRVRYQRPSHVTIFMLIQFRAHGVNLSQTDIPTPRLPRRRFPRPSKKPPWIPRRGVEYVLYLSLSLYPFFSLYISISIHLKMLY